MKKRYSLLLAFVLALTTALPAGLLVAVQPALASTVPMMLINGTRGSVITPGQSVTVTWSAPAGYTYCNTGVSPAYPNGWGSYIDLPPSGSVTITPTVASMRFQLQCAKYYPGPMLIEDGVASLWSSSSGGGNPGGGGSGGPVCTVPILNLAGAQTLKVHEQSSGPANEPARTYAFVITDPRLKAGGHARAGNHEIFTGAEYYKVYFSDAVGNTNANGPYVTIRSYRPANRQNIDVGGNIDAVGISFSNGQTVYASVVSSVQNGTGLTDPAFISSSGFANNALGAPNASGLSNVTYLGDNDASITLGFSADSGRCTPTSSSSSSSSSGIPQCRDGVDNDGDNRIDAVDPGCHSDGNPHNPNSYVPDDNDESNPGNTQCNDAADNDGDGLIDFPVDPGCLSPMDNDESNGGGGSSSSSSSSTGNIPQCRDGVDNDLDGATDFPFDFSCTSPDDNDESNPKSQCQDGFDNDGDGLIDSLDPGCVSRQDNSEFNGSTNAGASGNANANANAFNASTNVNTQNVTVTSGSQTINVPSPNINVTTGAPNITMSATASPVTTVNGGTTSGGSSQYPPYPPYPPYAPYPQYPQYPAQQQYPAYAPTYQYPSYIQNTQYSYQQPYGQVTPYQQPYVPYQQYSPYYQSPYSYSNANQCRDGIDNDNDGSIDYPQDLGCVNAEDNNEANDYGYYGGVAPQCRDGIDNDRDGNIDYPRDLSCSSLNDNDERYPLPHCSDGIDNDRDRLVDYPQDPGCVSPYDNNESRR